MEEGYIKFQCNWKKGPALSASMLQSVGWGRREMYNRGLIGAYDNGIGYGNISERLTEKKFVISGSATGGLPELKPIHYSVVDKIDTTNNQVWCTGPVKASSETMSHAVIYQTCPEVNAVVHIHNLDLWKSIIHRVPTTHASVSYGTPEMAKEIIRLLKQTDVRQHAGYFAMAGHEEGIIAFGKNMQHAINRISCLFDCGI
jgi:ribulose-5-phosphate 4-epimerase/fuculose-1-phosphate aldolase